MTPRKDVSMAPAEIERFLGGTHTAIFATLDREGFPHCAGMWYLQNGAELRMWTYAKSQKALNLERDDRCCVVVEEGAGYNELRGVTIRARAQLTTDQDEILQIGRELYERYTYPLTGIPVDQGPILEIQRQATKRVGVVVPMTRVASWDHAKL